jgi:acetyl esterase/lipase
VRLGDDVEVEDVSLPVGGSRRVMVRIFRSGDAPQPSPVVLYLSDVSAVRAEDEPNGLSDHQVRTIAGNTRAAVLVPSPGQDPGGDELEPLYEILCWIAQQGQRRWLDGTRVALAGTGSGAVLCARLAVLARERGARGVRAGSFLCTGDTDPIAWREAARFLSAALRTSCSGDAAPNIEQDRRSTG